MPYTIMVAVDGEPDHRAALDWAAARAARDGARLELVHVVERAWGDSTEEPIRLLVLAVGSLLEAEKQIALHRAREVRERRTVAAGGAGTPAEAVGDIEVGTRYRYGHIGPELASVSREADLLVIGTPAEEDRRRAFAGSLAVRVAAVAECPVAAIPHGWVDSGHGVVVGVDGELQTESAVEFAAAEAEVLDEPLTVACAGYIANPLLAGLVPEISLGDRRERVAADAAALAKERHPGVTVFTDVLDTAPSRGLVGEADGARMLVIGTHDRRGMQRLMLGSVGHDILLNVRTPVVVVRRARATAEDAGRR
ncbi:MULTISPECIES: universal stress protein [unclassified Leifsonia]|uniref:universal stress protein n=1 Tax=unclassified Leifsonia TaxID=2663824 RepID=UPI000362B715|nr:MULTISPECIES: universal stress protein [unclassified Leifsonia]TDP98942.1 nucleotide-binding universal stress UspA family protein [Leifsonia sp. 115AMFTsu3.1]